MDDDDTRESCAKILKRCAFLASPYIAKEPARLVRHHRRQMERAGTYTEKEINEPIHVIKLRHEVKPPPKPTGDTKDVDWKHRWWVQGFYRAQWYPSEQAHKVIWIAPYLKGPSDKPILEKVYSVVR